jgi:hypothetical protein
LNLSNEGIEKYLEGMDKESRAIKDEAIRMMWWMRGGLSYEDSLMLTNTEKEIINELIKDNMKSTKDSGLPFF